MKQPETQQQREKEYEETTKKNLAELMKCQLDNWMTEFDKLAKIHKEDNKALEDLKQGLESSWAVLEKTSGSRE